MKTEIITITNQNDTQSIQKVAQMLADGKLVAFPTETVYGIGCRAEPQAIEGLNHLKGRAPEKRYTLHVGNLGQLEAFVPRMSMRAEKLIRHALPGPLTAVFELDDDFIAGQTKKLGTDVAELLYRDNTIGVRFPDNPVACAILSAAECPVVAPSANPAGQAPATEFGQVKAYFDGQIDAIVDTPDSGCDYKNSSTVVKIGKKDVQILREGAIRADRIFDLSTIKILFVCTGNTCRSPVAEGVAKQHFANILDCSVDELDRLGYKIASAGVAAMPGMPASAESVQVCRKQGIAIEAHRSAPLTVQDIAEADVIFVMGRGHQQAILEYVPQAEAKCFLLDEHGDIADPIGQGLKTYQRCFKQIDKAIRQRASEIL